jgi:RNA-binding protein
MPPALSANQRRHLRSLAHPLRPVIMVGGKGVTDALLAELDGALERHELLKVKVAAEDREARDLLIGELVDSSQATLVQRVGNIATLFRRARENPQIILPR